jgi:hypothetical protein
MSYRSKWGRNRLNRNIIREVSKSSDEFLLLLASDREISFIVLITKFESLYTCSSKPKGRKTLIDQVNMSYPSKWGQNSQNKNIIREVSKSSGKCLYTLPSRGAVTKLILVWFEVFTTVTMKNAVFWDVAPCRSCVNRRFGATSQKTAFFKLILLPTRLYFSFCLHERTRYSCE